VVRRQLFIQEGLNGFEEQSLRNMMTEVINQSSENFRIYFKLGVAGELPNSWDEFKKFVVGFCIGESIFTIERFCDELYSAYFKRLREWCKTHKVSEEKLCKKLRGEKLPSELRSFFML
jgi:hypothetical protein